MEGCGEPALQGPYCWRCAVEAEALERQWQERQARKAARKGAPRIPDWIFAVLTMAALLLLGWMLRGYIQAWLEMWVGGRG